MLTRSQVAKRLGRSIATVRRLEGVELFPRRNSQGVHFFLEADVDELVRELGAGKRMPTGLAKASEQTSVSHRRAISGSMEELAEEVRRLEKRVRELETILVELLE